MVGRSVGSSMPTDHGSPSVSRPRATRSPPASNRKSTRPQRCTASAAHLRARPLPIPPRSTGRASVPRPPGDIVDYAGGPPRLAVDRVDWRTGIAEAIEVREHPWVEPAAGDPVGAIGSDQGAAKHRRKLRRRPGWGEAVQRSHFACLTEPRHGGVGGGENREHGRPRAHCGRRSSFQRIADRQAQWRAHRLRLEPRGWIHVREGGLESRRGHLPDAPVVARTRGLAGQSSQSVRRSEGARSPAGTERHPWPSTPRSRSPRARSPSRRSRRRASGNGRRNRRIAGPPRRGRPAAGRDLSSRPAASLAGACPSMTARSVEDLRAGTPARLAA